MLEQLQKFWRDGDFATLTEWISKVDPIELITDPVIAGYIVLIIVMNFIDYTKGMSQILAYYTIPVLFIFATVVILKNDQITSAGPFSMAIASLFMVVGWFVWAKMLRD